MGSTVGKPAAARWSATYLAFGMLKPHMSWMTITPTGLPSPALGRARYAGAPPMVTASPVSAEASLTTPLQQGPSMCAAMLLAERLRVLAAEMCPAERVARRAVTRAQWLSAQRSAVAVALGRTRGRKHADE